MPSLARRSSMPIRRTPAFYHEWVTFSAEAELRARLTEPQAVRQRLRAMATGVVEVYQDTYVEPAGGRFGPVSTSDGLSGPRSAAWYRRCSARLRRRPASRPAAVRVARYPSRC